MGSPQGKQNPVVGNPVVSSLINSASTALHFVCYGYIHHDDATGWSAWWVVWGYVDQCRAGRRVPTPTRLPRLPLVCCVLWVLWVPLCRCVCPRAGAPSPTTPPRGGAEGEGRRGDAPCRGGGFGDGRRGDGRRPEGDGSRSRPPPPPPALLLSVLRKLSALRWLPALRKLSTLRPRLLLSVVWCRLSVALLSPRLRRWPSLREAPLRGSAPLFLPVVPLLPPTARPRPVALCGATTRTRRPDKQRCNRLGTRSSGRRA